MRGLGGLEGSVCVSRADGTLASSLKLLMLPQIEGKYTSLHSASQVSPCLPNSTGFCGCSCSYRGWGRAESVAVVTVGVVELKLYQYLQLVQ